MDTRKAEFASNYSENTLGKNNQTRRNFLKIAGSVALGIAGVMGYFAWKDAEQHKKNGSSVLTGMQGAMTLRTISSAIPALEERMEQAIATGDEAELLSVQREVEELLRRLYEINTYDMADMATNVTESIPKGSLRQYLETSVEKTEGNTQQALLHGLLGDAYYHSKNLVPAYSQYGSALSHAERANNDALAVQVLRWSTLQEECRAAAEEHNREIEKNLIGQR